MKNSVTACIALAIAGFSSNAPAQFGAAPSDLDLVEVREDVYVIHNDFVPGNITALITGEGVLLVDTKYAIDYANVEAMLATVTDQPVRYVINTHFHDDHTGANGNLQSAGAIVLASDNARLKMLNNGRAEGLPGITIQDFASVHLGDTSVDLYYFGRAHTDGDIVVHLPDHGILVTGDIYANDPGTPEYIDYAGGGSAREWPRTLTRALALDFDTAIPGHGTVVAREEMASFRDETSRLAEMVQSMIRRSAPRQEIEQMLRSEFNFADFHVQGSLDGLLVELQ